MYSLIAGEKGFESVLDVVDATYGISHMISAKRWPASPGSRKRKSNTLLQIQPRVDINSTKLVMASILKMILDVILEICPNKENSFPFPL